MIGACDVGDCNGGGSDGERACAGVGDFEGIGRAIGECVGVGDGIGAGVVRVGGGE